MIDFELILGFQWDAGNAHKSKDKHGVSQAYVSDTLNGRRDPGPAICKALGIVAELSYRKVK